MPEQPEPNDHPGGSRPRLLAILLIVGIGAVLVGRDWIGLTAALALGTTLWVIGSALGLFFALAIPALMVRGGHYREDGAFAGWLMPVVSPMVTAARLMR